MRSILAHHLISAFNRAGVPAHTQAVVAWLAIQVAFGDDGSADAFTPRPAAATPMIGPMEPVKLSRCAMPAFRALSQLCISRNFAKYFGEVTLDHL